MGFSLSKNAALLIAWQAVGEVSNNNNIKINNLAEIIVNPSKQIIPKIQRGAPSESVTPAACTRVKKSGKRNTPTLPERTRNSPRAINV